MNLTQATVGRPTDTCRHLIVLCIFSHCDCQENKKSSVERLWIVIEEGGVLSPWLSRSSELAVIWLVARTVCVMTRGVKISWFYKGGLLVSYLFLLSLSSDEADREQRERRQKMARMISSGIECAVTPKLTGKLDGSLELLADMPRGVRDNSGMKRLWFDSMLPNYSSTLCSVLASDLEDCGWDCGYWLGIWWWW